jgi:hypothetical protein
MQRALRVFISGKEVYAYDEERRLGKVIDRD